MKCADCVGKQTASEQSDVKPCLTIVVHASLKRYINQVILSSVSAM